MLHLVLRSRYACVFHFCSVETAYSLLSQLSRRPVHSQGPQSSNTQTETDLSPVADAAEAESSHCRSVIQSVPVPYRLNKAFCLGKHVRKSAKMDEDSATASAACQHVKSDELCKGKWIGLHELTYKDPNGKERKWEAVFRTTKTGDGSDGVVIIPILKRRNMPDSVILVIQYRPPLKGYSLEFPAGLIDKGEDIQECAVRELKEETGYTGVPMQTSPGVSLDPGLANCTVTMVTVEIDGDKECNRKPGQQQDEGEFIEVISVPMDDLLNTLDSYSKRGVVVHCVLYTYAMTLSQMAKKPVS